MKSNIPIKTLLIGEARCGKTSMINQLLYQNIDGDYRIHNELFYPYSVSVDGNEYPLQIFDTKGDEKYRKLNGVYFPNSKIVLFVFDMTNRASFEKIKDYWNDVMLTRKRRENDFCVFVVATKADDILNYAIKDEEVDEFCKENGYEWKLVSSIVTDEVIDLFNLIVEKYVRGHYRKNHYPIFRLLNKKENNNKKSDNCI